MPNTDMTFCLPHASCPWQDRCARYLPCAEVPKDRLYISDFLVTQPYSKECEFFRPKDREVNNERHN